MFFPSIIETTGRSSRSFDLPTKLLQNRIVYLAGEINDESANIVIMQLLWLNADNPDQPINLYINSPGGNVYSGLAIKDLMYSLECKVNTFGVGFCASMGAYLLAAGTGERKATQNTRIVIHSVSAGTQGTIHDMAIDFKESKFLHDHLLSDLESFTKGKSTRKSLNAKTQRDYYMGVQEAIKMGLIDDVV